ncbi:MAG: hypothetical protein NTY87_11180 [Planctomycetia bacterium]|nr:hypothetical protein [Planctomycetia bacterium]RLT15002.1 MAG: hypothetical protein DWI25_03390 [Planctomycetota bacterium]
MPRFVILEHRDAPDDPARRHFDLLIELSLACRTWRLIALPQAGGESVAAIEIAPHRLEWLDHLDGEVSQGRGRARRMTAGTFTIQSADAQQLADASVMVLGVVEITENLLGGRLQLSAIGDANGWCVAVG